MSTTCVNTTIKTRPERGGARSVKPSKAKLRGLAAASIASVACLTATVPSASAMSVQHRWYGMDVQLNRSETNNLMFGTISAAAVATAIPDPTLSKVASVGFGVYSGYAGWIYNRGGCMKFRVTYSRQVVPAHYWGGPCR